MSGAPQAKATVARAGDPVRAPKAAAFQTTRGWSPPAHPTPPLKIARADDPCEAEADRAAELALTGGGPPAFGGKASPPGVIQAKAGASVDTAPPGLHRRIEAAASEGRSLPKEQRGAFEQGFGHRFGDVRIHDGPASARAATAAGAQAFALGRDIYFGASEFRPESEPGRKLLAHELAHVVQQRPHVVARRALPAPSHLPAPDDVGTAPGAAAVSDDFLEDAPDAASAREKLHALDPATRASALGRAGSRMGQDGREKLEDKVEAARDKGKKDGRKDASKDASTPEGELRAQPPAPAPVSKEKDAAAPAPGHERASADAAAAMEKAAGLVAADPELEGAAEASGAAPAAPRAPGGKKNAGAAASAASVASSEAVAALNARLAELAEVRAMPARFQATDNPPGDPVAFTRQRESETLAKSFVDATASAVEGLIGEALGAPPQVLAGLGAARQNVAASLGAQAAALKDAAGVARKQIEGQAARTHGSIAARRADTMRAADADAQVAKDRAKAARDKASGGIGKKADSQKTDISKDYQDAEAPLIGVGVLAGDKARQAARAWKTKLPPYLTDWSVLDGPYENDRIDAKKETADKVAEEYAKSFLASAREQAAKLPDSKPEVLGKIDEISKQAGTGLTDQLGHMDKGAEAFVKGAKKQADVSGAKLSGALAASAKETAGAMDAARDQQDATLSEQAASLHASLDQSGAAALASLSQGVGESSGQLIGSIRDFVASLADMPPPASEEMAPALEGTRASAESSIVGMRGQVAAIGPTLIETFKTTADQGGQTLAATVAAASQSLEASTQSFGESAAGLNRQAAQGFGAMRAGNKKTAKGMGDDAEKGFAEAETNAGAAFGQFEKQVLDTFKTGRDQMTAGLWSAETREKLDKDMTDFGEQAAEQIKPRWKSVLKWVITIVIILAVIAITVLSAGALGPVGVILLGAALGAAAGAVQTIADNLIDNKPWSQGVVKAMIVGAIGGAVGGAGGVLLKGVGSVALRIGAEAVINVAGGVAGEAIGSLAVGQSINWTGALMGALVGAGIGAGLGIAGALKGKIKIGGFGKGGGAPEVVIEPPPPKPAGKIRVALEKAKILAPGKPAPLPEINVGGKAGGETAPTAPAPGVEPAPAAAVAPKEPIGFKPPGETPRAPAAAEPATAAPKEPIGFKLPGETPRAPAAAEPATAAPKEPIGFKLPGETPRAPAAAESATAAPKEPIGFKLPGETPRAPTAAEPATAAPKEPIGFKLPGEAPRAPAAEPATAAPKEPVGFRMDKPKPPAPTGEPTARPAKQKIGFRLSSDPPRLAEPTPAEPAGGAPADFTAAPRPRPISFEPSTPRPTGGGFEGRVEPIRAGGRSTFEPQAVAKPGGGGKPLGGEHTIAEPAPAKPLEPAKAAPAKKPVAPVAETTPVKAKPSAQPAAEPAPASAEPAAPTGKKAAPPAAEQQPAKKPTETAETPKKPPEPFDMKQIGAKTEPPQILDPADFSKVKLKPGQDALYILRDINDGTILKVGKTSEGAAPRRFLNYKNGAISEGREVQLEVHPLKPSKHIAEHFEKALRTNMKNQGHAMPWDHTGKPGAGFGTPGEGKRTPPLTKGEMEELLTAHKGDLREAGKELGVHRQTVRLWAKSLGLKPIEFK